MPKEAELEQDAPTTATEPPPEAAEAEVSLAEALGIDPNADHQPDSDEARVIASLRELEQEEAAGADTAPAAQAPDATQQQPDATQQQAPAQVPVAAVQAERQKRQAAELELAKAQGKNELLTDLLVKGVITPEHARAVQEGRAELSAQHQQQVDAYADIDARDIALATKYEAGDISHVDYRKEQIKLDRERQEIGRKVERQARQEQAIEEAKPAAAQIEGAFPSLSRMNQQQLDACAPLARVRAQAVLDSKGAGQFDSSNPAHLRIFHFHVAHLADSSFNGGRDFAAFQASRKGTQGTPPNGQQPKPTNPNVPQVARKPDVARVTNPAQLIRDKVQLSQQMAPDVTGLNDRRNSVPTSEEQQIINMSTEDVAALPKDRLNQLLGLT